MYPTSIALVALFSFVLSATAHAAVITITPADNYRAAMQGLTAGDTLILRGGYYPLSTIFNLNLVGTAVLPITIRAAYGEQPVISFIDATQNIVNITNSAFLTIDGIEFTGGSNGLRLTASSDITIRNCRVHHTADSSINATAVGSTYSRLRFEHNEIHHAGGLGSGVELGCNGANCVVKDSVVANNYLHDLNDPSATQGVGIYLRAGSYGVIVRDNVVHTTREGIVLQHGIGNAAPNIVERNVVWNSGGVGIQVGADATVRNNIILSAGGDGISLRSSTGYPVGNISVVSNSVLKSGGTVLRIVNVAGAVTVANNALYTATGTAVNASGTVSLITMLANVGVGSLIGVSTGFNAGGNISADFSNANYSGLPPQNLVPMTGQLVGTADASQLPTDDFDGAPRGTLRDVGAYRSDPAGRAGWELQPGFKIVGRIFASGFDN